MANRPKNELRKEVQQLRAEGLKVDEVSEHFKKKGVKMSPQMVSYYSKVNKKENEKLN